jgi:hypothetical protein
MVPSAVLQCSSLAACTLSMRRRCVSNPRPPPPQSHPRRPPQPMPTAPADRPVGHTQHALGGSLHVVIVLPARAREKVRLPAHPASTRARPLQSGPAVPAARQGCRHATRPERARDQVPPTPVVVHAVAQQSSAGIVGVAAASGGAAALLPHMWGRRRAPAAHSSSPAPTGRGHRRPTHTQCLRAGPPALPWKLMVQRQARCPSCHSYPCPNACCRTRCRRSTCVCVRHTCPEADPPWLTVLA